MAMVAKLRRVLSPLRETTPGTCLGRRGARPRPTLRWMRDRILALLFWFALRLRVVQDDTGKREVGQGNVACSSLRWAAFEGVLALRSPVMTGPLGGHVCNPREEKVCVMSAGERESG